MDGVTLYTFNMSENVLECMMQPWQDQC